jgi:hypothetical protein
MAETTGWTDPAPGDWWHPTFEGVPVEAMEEMQVKVGDRVAVDLVVIFLGRIVWATGSATRVASSQRSRCARGNS